MIMFGPDFRSRNAANAVFERTEVTLDENVHVDGLRIHHRVALEIGDILAFKRLARSCLQNAQIDTCARAEFGEIKSSADHRTGGPAKARHPSRAGVIIDLAIVLVGSKRSAGNGRAAISLGCIRPLLFQICVCSSAFLGRRSKANEQPTQQAEKGKGAEKIHSKSAGGRKLVKPLAVAKNFPLSDALAPFRRQLQLDESSPSLQPHACNRRRHSTTSRSGSAFIRREPRRREKRQAMRDFGLLPGGAIDPRGYVDSNKTSYHELITRR